jgi:hypothetical protein
MFKNTASQNWVVFAFQDEGGANPGEPVTGLADITGNLYLDGSATPNAIDDLNPTELGGGYYAFGITAAESNADNIAISAASATANVNVIGVPGSVYTSPATPDVNVIQISGDTTAADNLELQYDGTGISGDNYPATQSQVGSISVASAAINVVNESYNLTVGVQSSGTEANARSLDGVSHQHTDTAGAIDLYYEFDVTDSGIPVSCKIDGAITGNNDDVDVYAYNWAGTSWDQVGNLPGTITATITERNYDLLTAHVGTGANLGKVRIRLFKGSGLTTATLYIDRMLVSYAVSQTGIANGTTVTLATSTTNTNLIGNNWNLALGGQDISGSYIRGAEVSGISSGSTEVTFEDCHFAAGTYPPGTYIRCGFGESDGLFTAASAGEYTFKDCYSIVAGAGSPDFTFAGLGSTTGINNRGFFGGSAWTLDSNCTLSHEVVAGGGTSITPAGAGVEVRGVCRALTLALGDSDVGNAIQTIIDTGVITITTSGTLDSSTINLYGHAKGLVDTSSAGTTVNNWLSGFIQTDAILTDTNAIITDTNELQGDWTDGGRLDLILDDILLDTGTDGVKVAAADQTAIADALLNRDMSAVSDTTARSPLNALRLLRNKYSVSGTTLTVTKEDDTTSAWTSVLTTDASANPVTGSDPA